jgi:hypothetical protein
MPIDWSMISAIAVASTAIGVAARHFYGWATQDNSIASQSQSALALATAAIAKIELLIREFADRGERYAERFAKVEAAASAAMQAQIAAEGRMTQAIQEVGRDVRGMSDRIDRVLEKRGG